MVLVCVYLMTIVHAIFRSRMIMIVVLCVLLIIGSVSSTVQYYFLYVWVKNYYETKQEEG